MNALHRLFYRVAYRLILVWWFLRRPLHHGALVALWHEGRLLLVRTSYRRGWGLPGGGIKRGETPLQAVLREAREEIGVTLDPALLSVARDTTHVHAYCRDHTIVFEQSLVSVPPLRIDGREIVSADFIDPAVARGTRVAPYLRDYLTHKGYPPP
jgi:8-oxo-dGTP pyrophosphatase MutT (NUDIX family)